MEVAPSKGFNIKIDKEAPIISYDLSEGTYDENKVVKVSVNDNRKINFVEYKLYKDDTVISSGNPNIEDDKYVSFENNLDNDGTWKLEVVANDKAGNVANETRSFVINTGPVCEWVGILSSTPNSCTSVSKPSNPSEGNTYTVCNGPKYGNWRYYCPQILCADGTVISSVISSDYIYTSKMVAQNMVDGSWGVAATRCDDHEGVITNNQYSAWHNYCQYQQLTYYQKNVYEYRCADITSPVISYNLEAGTYDEAKTVTVTVTDNRKIASVEYKLYKDGVLELSGNPTGSSTNISFDNNLNSSGTWKLDVVAIDEVLLLR